MTSTVSGAETYSERVLTTKRLRHMLRRQRTRLIPDALATRIRRKAPMIHEPDVVEIVQILEDLVDRVSNEFSAAGILPAAEQQSRMWDQEQRLTALERRHAADFSALLCWTSRAWSLLGARDISERPDGEPSPGERADRHAAEAVAWGRISGDRIDLAWSLLAHANRLEFSGRGEEATDLYREMITHLGEKMEKGPTGSPPPPEREILLILHYLLGRLLYRQGDHDGALAEYDRAEGLIRPGADADERNMRVGILIGRSNVARYRKDLAAALAYAQEGMLWSDSEFDPEAHTALLQTTALIYRTMGHEEEALKLLLEAIATLEATGLSMSGAPVYLTASRVYHRLGEFGRAHAILDRIEGFAGIDPENPDENPGILELRIRMGRGEILIDEGEYERAAELLDSVIENGASLEPFLTIAGTCSLVARIRSRQGRHAEAAAYLRRGIGIAHPSDHHNRTTYLLELARAEVAQGNLQEGTRILDEVEPTLRSDDLQRAMMLRIRGTICEVQNDYRAALELEREQQRIEREIAEEAQLRSLRHARIVAETTMYEKAMEKEKERYRRLEHDFAEVSIKLVEREKLMEEIRERLDDLLRNGEADATGSKRLRELRGLLSMVRQESGESAITYIDADAQEFLNSLRRAWPGLTGRQERLAVLIRAGLSNSEICSLMDIGSEGLKSHRKRLRKALGVGTGESLEGVIAAIR